MSHDLYTRGEKDHFKVNMYGWPRLRLALEFLGADAEKMVTDNSGTYVPAATAREWASAIEQGIDGLCTVVVKDEFLKNDEGWFWVPRSFGKKEAHQLLKDYYGQRQIRKFKAQDSDGRWSSEHIAVKGHRSYRLMRFEPMSEDHNSFLLRFAGFCQRSGGFYQW